MKKIAVIIISVFCALMAGQVLAEEETEEKTFCATVLEIDEVFILVQPHFDMKEYDNSDQMYVGLDEVDHAQLEEFLDMVTVDDTVQITYNGKIMETYPAQIIASDIECLETSEMAATVAELIEGEGFQTEFSMGGSEYCCEYAESLTIWPSAEEDDPEGDPDEEVDYMTTLGWITVFHYTDSDMAEAASEAFDPDDPSMFVMECERVVIDYMAPIRFYLQEECIVLYGGTNETVISLLSGELGEPFAYNDY
ncbi:MAG: YobA family protein [Lachnospiraceae bacterium]|nr:YobA family protein [Lachnospiraceae bacterium]